MASIHSGVTDRAAVKPFKPLAITVARACELSGFGPTSIWAFLKDHRLEAVRVPGVRRTLISYQSLMELLAPPADRASPRKNELAEGTPAI